MELPQWEEVKHFYSNAIGGSMGSYAKMFLEGKAWIKAYAAQTDSLSFIHKAHMLNRKK